LDIYVIFTEFFLESTCASQRLNASASWCLVQYYS